MERAAGIFLGMLEKLEFHGGFCGQRVLQHLGLVQVRRGAAPEFIKKKRFVIRAGLAGHGSTALAPTPTLGMKEEEEQQLDPRE